ncbi:alpha/beta fold hydrolase [Arsukibacterium sp.]|uniref:alpha/beta fold hydrolase n=1 Tax=Arsukibacterium sp. TaxID=1977258 RepID=UPI00356327CF
MKTLILSLAIIGFIGAGNLYGAEGAAGSTVKLQINDVKLEVEKQGKGDVTVVFEAGFGTDLRTWQPVIAALGNNTSTIAYSRAGLGQSTGGNAPRNIQQHINDLHTLLTALKVNGEIVLVGHSYGGLLATEYARQFPEQISALVLIDPAVMAQRKVFLQADKNRVLHDDQMLLKMMPTAMQQDYQLLITQLDAAPDRVNPVPSAIRTSLITSTKGYEKPFVFEETQLGKQLWLNLHNDLFKDVTHGQHIRVSDAGHNLHQEKPQLIAQAIIGIINRQ